MKAKAKWLFGLGGVIAVVLIGMQLWAVDVQPVKIYGTEGVIVKAGTAEKWGLRRLQPRMQSFWTAETRDIEVVESRLHAALEAGVKDPASVVSGPLSDFSRAYRVKTIERVLNQYDRYRRQYVGMVVDGKRYLLLNSFPKGVSMDEQKGYIVVDDGGEAFWRILYSVEDGRFLEFSANGGA